MTRQIKVGNVKIGGGVPVVIQSMTKTDTRDISATVRQVRELEIAGCELVRVAVKDSRAARAIRRIKRKIKIPLVADIHFDYRLAIMAIENGADKIRLNPGNIYKEDQILKVVKAAKRRKVPIRVGVNAGSLVKRTGCQSWHPARLTGVKCAKLMVSSALDYIKTLEKVKFYDIIVSLKASDVLTTIDAYRMFSKKSDYPLHLGITAAGPVSTGMVKSSIGIGVLLLEGIGDTLRVSLTGSPCEEVIVARDILQALGLRQFRPEIISCPTCGRCQVDLQKIVKEIETQITRYTLDITQTHFPKVAIMGCEVNGPGEAREADIGIAFGKGTGVLFKKGKIIKRIKPKDTIKELLTHYKPYPLQHMADPLRWEL